MISSIRLEAFSSLFFSTMVVITADIGNDEKSQAMVRANLTAGFVFEL